MGKIINCFYDGAESGFGDFLRGSIHLYERTKTHGLDFAIDITHHPISEFIETDSVKSFKKSSIKCLTKQIKKEGFKNYADSYNQKVFDELSSIEANQTKHIFSYFDYASRVKHNHQISFINKSPKLSKDCSRFFKKNLNFSDELRDEVKKELDNHELKNKKFNIIHFRLGDEKAFYKTKERFFTPEFQECFEICRKKSKTWKNPIVILSDSNELKTFIRDNAEREKIPLHVFHLESSHMQEHPSGCEESNSRVNVSRNGLFYTCFDMMLISLACRGLSYSVYDHGSGFFCWLCKIYNIPFKMQKFNSNEK